MTKIAYKTNSTNPNLPNGFITDHFETDQDTVEGYTVVDQDTFQAMIHSNVTLLRQHEVNLGIQGAPHGIPVHPRRNAEEAQAVDPEIMAAKKNAVEQHATDAKLFHEFLAWKKSQDAGS